MQYLVRVGGASREELALVGVVPLRIGRRTRSNDRARRSWGARGIHVRATERVEREDTNTVARCGRDLRGRPIGP